MTMRKFQRAALWQAVNRCERWRIESWTCCKKFLQATDSCENLNSAQRAVSSSKWKTWIPAVVLRKKLNTVKYNFKANTFPFSGSERVSLLRQNFPLYLLFWNLCRKVSDLPFVFLCCILSVSVIVPPPCDRAMCRFLFDRSGLSSGARVNPFEQKHASEREESGTSYQHSSANPTVATTGVFASPLK